MNKFVICKCFGLNTLFLYSDRVCLYNNLFFTAVFFWCEAGIFFKDIVKVALAFKTAVERNFGDGSIAFYKHFFCVNYSDI